MVSYKVVYYSRLTGEPLADQQIPKIREDIEGNENETSSATYPEGVYVKITNTETGEETITLVDEEFYPTSSGREEFDEMFERNVAASGTEVTHFYSYYDLIPTEGVKQRTSSVYERPEWTFPTLEEYPMKMGITEENYEQYLPEVDVYENGGFLVQTEQGNQQLFPEIRDYLICKRPCKGGWTKKDIQNYLQKTFQNKNIPVNIPKRFSFGVYDTIIRLLFKIDQGNFTFTELHLKGIQILYHLVDYDIYSLKRLLYKLVEYEAKCRIEKEQSPFSERIYTFLEKTKVLEQVLELYPSPTHLWDQNFNGCRERHGSLHSYRYSDEGTQTFYKCISGQVRLRQLTENSRIRSMHRRKWVEPGELLAQIEEHSQLFTDYLEYLNFFETEPVYANLDVLKAELTEFQRTLMARFVRRMENHYQRASDYNRNREESDSSSDDDYRQTSNCSSDWKHPNPLERQENRDLVTVQIASRELAQISQLTEALKDVRTKYGQETFELLSLLVGDDCTQDRIDSCLKTIINQLGTTEELVEISLIEKFTNKVVSPKGPVRVRNLLSMIDLETIYYLLPDDDLVVDSSGLAYSIEELRELHRSSRSEARPFRNIENIYFSDLDPLYLGRNFYKDLKLNKLVQVSL